MLKMENGMKVKERNGKKIQANKQRLHFVAFLVLDLAVIFAFFNLDM